MQSASDGELMIPGRSRPIEGLPPVPIRGPFCTLYNRLCSNDMHAQKNGQKWQMCLLTVNF
jgi:hypothetical protein